MSAVMASALRKTFRSPVEDVHVLRGVDLTVRAGDFLCITGVSGSGKSTLMNVLAGLDEPDSGELCILGHDVVGLRPAARARLRLESIGIVFQDNNLVPDFTVRENLEIVLRAAGHRDTSREMALAALASVGVEELQDRFPREISGGQAQRVGVARAVASGKKLILADEPTGALDRANSEALFDLLAGFAADGIAVVLCTHDPMAQKFASRALVFCDGVLVASE